MSKKIFFIGHFGYKDNQLDGQTIKSRVVKDFFSSKEEFEVKFVDVSCGFNIRTILNMLLTLFYFDHIIFLPGKNQLTAILKILRVFSFICPAKLHYIVIGGWLYDYIKESKERIKAIKHFDSVSCESNFLVKNLNDLGINCCYMPNFRESIPDLSVTNCGSNIKFFFFARIIREKGIFEAIDVVRNLRLNNIDCTLDIYGPLLLEEDDKALFESYIGDGINYKGALEPDKNLHYKLNRYDILLFPTYYHGEGMPGTIIDAKMAGTLPIVSDWKYNSEFVDNGITGYVVSNDNYVDNTVEIIRNLSSVDIFRLKSNSLKSSSDFAADNVMGNWIKENIT